MPRRVPLVLIAVSLLAGAAATYAVAWVCSTRSSTKQTRKDLDEELPPDLAAAVPAQWMVRQFPDAQGSMMTVVNEHTGTGLFVQEVAIEEMIPGLDKMGYDHYLYVRRAGWPLLSLKCTESMTGVRTGVVERGIPVPKWLPQVPTPRPLAAKALLPLGPLWPGFAADTLLYATTFFLLCQGLAAARRGLRTRRGLCPRCAYDRRGLTPTSPCPECGTTP